MVMMTVLWWLALWWVQIQGGHSGSDLGSESGEVDLMKAGSNSGNYKRSAAGDADDGNKAKKARPSEAGKGGGGERLRNFCLRGLPSRPGLSSSSSSPPFWRWCGESVSSDGWWCCGDCGSAGGGEALAVLR
jgi:hypothetical protein